MRLPALLQATIVIVVSYLILDNAFPPLLPLTLMIQYMIIVVVGVLLYFSFNDECWDEFLSPIKSLLRDDNKWRETVINHWNLLDSLPKPKEDEMTMKERKKYLGAVMTKLENATGIETLDLDKIDKKSNPFLYILSMIAKAFGASFHVDENNAIVGWSGKGDKEAFVKIASDIVEQKAMITMFKENKITNPGVKRGLNKVLFNSKCLPAGSVTEIKKASELREEFIKEISKINSDENAKNIVEAMDFLNKRPLRIVGKDEFGDPRNTLNIRDISGFVTEPSRYYPPEKKEDEEEEGKKEDKKKP